MTIRTFMRHSITDRPTEEVKAITIYLPSRSSIKALDEYSARGSFTRYVPFLLLVALKAYLKQKRCAITN